MINFSTTCTKTKPRSPYMYTSFWNPAYVYQQLNSRTHLHFRWYETNTSYRCYCTYFNHLKTIFVTYCITWLQELGQKKKKCFTPAWQTKLIPDSFFHLLPLTIFSKISFNLLQYKQDWFVNYHALRQGHPRSYGQCQGH